MATKIIGQGPATPNTASNAFGVSTLTAAQLELVLENIAGQAATLCDLIRLVQSGAEGADVATDAALIAAVSIGQKADAAVGSSIIGDAHEWHYGPNFTNAGKAVQHD